MAFTFEELEEAIQSKQVDGEVVEEDEFDEEESITYNDLYASTVLLRKLLTMCDYISEPTLCKRLSKRERAIFSRLSTEINEFICGLQENYEEI